MLKIPLSLPSSKCWGEECFLRILQMFLVSQKKLPHHCIFIILLLKKSKTLEKELIILIFLFFKNQFTQNYSASHLSLSISLVFMVSTRFLDKYNFLGLHDGGNFIKVIQVVLVWVLTSYPEYANCHSNTISPGRKQNW